MTSKPSSCSGNEVLNDCAGYVCQSEASSQMFVYHFFMVNAQLVQQGGLEIMDMHWVFHNIIAKIIGLAIHHPWLNAPTCHPDGKCLGMMVPSVVVDGYFSLAVVGSAKLPAPDDQAFV